MESSDVQWDVIAPMFPAGRSRAGWQGRPSRGNKEVLEGVLWVSRTGARWQDLPHEFPPYQTCNRRFGEWTADGTLTNVL